ncbi:MAG: hypothetical protein ABI696_04055 [Rubrivivax sp.]
MTAPLRAALAFALLNTLLTFENRWPGFGVTLIPRLSFELCLALAALAVWVGWRGVPGRRAAGVLAAGVVALAGVRYADVTVPVVLGRPVHVYWDGRHAVELLRLATQGWAPWQLAAAGAAIVGALLAVAALARFSITTLAQALRRPSARAGVLAATALLLASFVAYEPGGRDTRWFFSLPLAPTIAHQGLLLARLWGPGPGDAVLGPGPDFGDERPASGPPRDAAGGIVGGLDGGLAGRSSGVDPARRADVVLLFAESYGAVAFDDPALAAALAPAREGLALAATASGRGVVSARVTSPTFGGASWLAHGALLAGIDTRDPQHHALLLASTRPTLVRHFARRGWRTVGWMPGIKRPWPEGAFYGFDRVADDAGIGYTGPDFGYWRIPDQAAMALLHAQELADRPGDPTARVPRFVVFPTSSTHAPFHPLAPFVDDWTRLLGPAAYDAATAAAAVDGPASRGDPRAHYVDGLRYQFHWLADYLRRLARPGLVLVIIGDHQPPAMISGAGANWDVPVHVVADDPALLQRLLASGFVPGLVPPQASNGPMHALTGVLLRAIEGRSDAAPIAAVAAVVPGSVPRR